MSLGGEQKKRVLASAETPGVFDGPVPLPALLPTGNTDPSVSTGINQARKGASRIVA